MRRHLPRLLLTGALLSPVTLYALGLGEIRLNSALNQPFDAEIELIAPTADELAGLQVALASPDMFARYGLDRPIFLSTFDFTISRSRDGRALVKVTSDRSITEPFVTLLVEASWARGRLLREYTVLLDPPVFMPSEPEAPAPVTTPQTGTQTGRIERQVAQQPQPQEEAEPEAATPLPTPPSTSGAQESLESDVTPIVGEYTVERNDTLWRIASRVTPGGSRRDTNRTMIALFRANPAAFNANINRLRSGSVLRIPDLAEMEAISASEASQEVARQVAEWSGAQPTQVAEESSRLRLVTPEETPTAPTTAAPTPEQPTAQAPIAPTTGTPTPEDKRLELPSAGLAEAQRNVAEAPVEQPPEVQPSTQEPSQTETPSEAPPVAEQPAQPKPIARPPVRPTQGPAPSLMDRIGDYWWVPVVVGLLVVVGLVLAFIRRRREESNAAVDSMAGLDFEPRATRAVPAMSPSTRARDRGDSFLVEDTDEDTLEEPAPAPTARRTEPPRSRVEPAMVPATAAATTKIEDTLSSETAVRFDQQDALAEADFHMAYGLYDQAADLVKIAIDREPRRRDLKLKLLEIYFVWGNKDLFLDAARDLHATRAQAASGEWDKVLIMGKQIAPDDTLFKGEAGAHVDLVDVNLEGGENRVDVDLFAEPDGDRPAGLDLEFTSGERKGPGSDLDFLLDEPKRGSQDEPTREFDQLARTQETPTIESPMIDRSSQTIREKTLRDKADRGLQKAEQTAELSLDDLGLDVDDLENTGSLEDTTSLEKDTGEDGAAPLRDDELTQLAPSLSSFDRTMQAPVARDKFDVESTGTIYIDQVDLSAGGDTIEQRRLETDSTASMKRPGISKDLDVDLDHLSGIPPGPDTVRQARGGDPDADRFSTDVFADRTSEVPRVDLDVGEPLSSDDTDATHRRTVVSSDVLSELEPVTMSEVGTKLDLARAYMDMGDPDGARSILEEVLSEGNPNQKQEAQRLMESIR
jgi:pilus assembly protein FimV